MEKLNVQIMKGYNCFMSLKEIEPCPVCDSNELKYVYYAPGEKDFPELYYDDVNEGFIPLILFKRIECRKCGATVSTPVMTIDQAIEYWNSINPKTNKRYVFKKIKEEDIDERRVK